MTATPSTPPGDAPSRRTTARLAVDAGGHGFAEFYAASCRSLIAQLYAYTGDLAAAQDLAQDAFCRAYLRWNRISRYDDPAGWVRRVAWNLARSRWRRLRTAQVFARGAREEHVEGPNPDRVALVAALAKLPEQHRRAVVLYHLADLPVADIAAQEGVAPATVRVWLHRGRVALTAHLSDDRTGVRRA